MTLNVLLRGRIYEWHSYAVHTRSAALALHAAGVNTRIEPIRDWSQRILRYDSGKIPDDEWDLLDVMVRNEFNGGYYRLDVAPPQYWRRDAEASKNVGVTVFETESIPREWVDCINRVGHDVWVATEYNRRGFIESGVETRVSVVPETYEGKFTPDAEAAKLPLKSGFNFLSVFNWNPRKDWKKLLLAFCEEFSSEDDVGLVLKLSDNWWTKGMNIRAIKGYLRGVGGEGVTRRVAIMHDLLHNQDMPGLYRSCDAFVLPSRGEGWGRPYQEALLCETPVIYSRCSAMLETLNESIGYPIEGELTPVYESVKKEPELLDNKIVKRVFMRDGMRWFENDVGSLRKQMRRVYEKPEEAKEKAKRGREWVLERYSPTVVGNIMVKRLES